MFLFAVLFRDCPAALFIHSCPLLPPAGQPGFSSQRGDQPADAGAQPPDLRRRPVADIHLDAQRLLPSIPQLGHLQIAPAEHFSLQLRVVGVGPGLRGFGDR